MRLDTLTRILDHQGPFASAMLDVSRTTEDAGRLLELRSRAARTELTEAGAPRGVAAALADRMAEPTGRPGETGRFVVASEADGVLVDETLPGWSGAEVLTWGPLPDVTAWLAYQDCAVPVLVVLADHVGADLHHHAAWGREPATTTIVDGSTENISKVPDGGLARADLQSRTDEQWRLNARAVAAEIERLAAATPPPLIVLAGDPRARHDIREALSPHLAERLVESERGSRADGAGMNSLTTEVDVAVTDAVARRRQDDIDRFQEHVGRQEAVAVGLGPVLEMAVMASIDTVVLDEDRAAGTLVRPADHPYLPLPDGVRSADSVRSDLLVLAAAAATGAGAVFAAPPDLPEDGVAALLRWDRPPG
ncbi:hypothetical protein E1212_20335 [Jiangella ureilytica]|uniref:Peptide chain release factor 1 n=1 Tax=Jiangella ureilytica TaxID=2530374 RepID=A0A4R4RHD7_9ACTN|nr:Vms1/Ankzf1 family peptidyl-tRNA hydrolase [Jiangella ureilytica]TDC48724.1 hypothetical protein E1212_20335 [Jiangella ureilytica]